MGHGNGNVLASYGYSYDAAGQLSSETDNGVTTNYAYNATGELIQAGATTYAYDANGNPIQTGTVIGPNNELLSDGTWNYQYDAAGNQIGKVNIATGETWSYVYNNANQLVSAVDESSSGTVLQQETNTYDVFGNRIAETETTGGSTTTTEMSYDQNGTLYADLNSSGTITTRYISSVTGPDEWLARVDATGGGAWLLSDHLGSVRTVVALTGGTVLDQITFDPFGTITSQTNSANMGRLGFQGGQLDPITVTYNFGERNYNPGTGTWTTQDPDGLSAGSNSYEFAGNMPTIATDPSGLQLIVYGEESLAKWTVGWLGSLYGVKATYRVLPEWRGNGQFAQAAGGGGNNIAWNIIPEGQPKQAPQFKGQYANFDQQAYEALFQPGTYRFIYYSSSAGGNNVGGAVIDEFSSGDITQKSRAALFEQNKQLFGLKNAKNGLTTSPATLAETGDYVLNGAGAPFRNAHDFMVLVGSGVRMDLSPAEKNKYIRENIYSDTYVAGSIKARDLGGEAGAQRYTNEVGGPMVLGALTYPVNGHLFLGGYYAQTKWQETGDWSGYLDLVALTTGDAVIKTWRDLSAAIGETRGGPTRIYSVQGNIQEILASGRVWGQTEGSVYGMAEPNAPLWKTMAKSPLEMTNPGVIQFEGPAAQLFKPHPIEGPWSGMKRGLGQYKAGFGDIVFTEPPVVSTLPDGRLLLIVKSAELGKHAGQSTLRAYGRLWGRRLILEPGLTAAGAATAYVVYEALSSD